MRTGSEPASTQHSFWADDPAAEEKIWEAFLEKRSRIEKPRLIHYGSYETQFLRRMRARYPNTRSPAFLDELVRSALNLLSIIYAHVYFPTYSNGLTEVAQYLGCRWSENGASGFRALIWRSNWESSRDPDLKQKLLTYNAEDCEATQRVAEALPRACGAPGFKKSDNVHRQCGFFEARLPQRFGKADFLLPEFQKINEAAYWDYQRNRVNVRSDTRLVRRRALKQNLKTRLRPNKSIIVDAACFMLPLQRNVDLQMGTV